MSVSPIEFTKEKVRQAVTQDENFLKRLLYYFELELPVLAAGVATGVSNRFVFPLILPPQAYTIDEPFSYNLTPTQRGGVYVEENGIMQRPIKIRGTTGFKPRLLKTFGGVGGAPPGPVPATHVGINAQTKSYSRELPTVVASKVSGQRHFQYLQDSVFRTYADFKRDPATSKDTKLYFHNPKDDEHFRVIPARFGLDREKGQPTLYNYSIDLIAIDKADAGFDVDFDDKNILDHLQNALYMASLGLDLVSGAIDDMTAIQDDIATQLSNITVLIDGATNIATSTQDFVNGTEDLINVPYAYLISYAELADETAAAADLIEDFPETIAATLRRMSDGFDMIGANPPSFESSNDSSMGNVRDQQELRRTVSQETQTEVLNTPGPTTVEELNELGTGLTPGEVTAAQGTMLAGGEIRKYRSARKVTVGKGDTLASLAAQYMGDARLWQYVAIANGLKPPFVDDQASTPLTDGGADETPFGQSLGRGGKILIPNNSASPTDYPQLPVLGVRIEEDVDNQLLGIDAKLVTVNNVILGDSRARYDVEADVEHGSKDVKLVEGINNLEQVIALRIVTEFGTDPMYKNVGLKRIVGLNFDLADLANARFRLRETILSDARVSSIRNLKFSQNEDALDKLITEMDAVPRGYSESRPITAIV